MRVMCDSNGEKGAQETRQDQEGRRGERNEE